MKDLPDEQTLLELLEMAKDAEQYTRETCEFATKIAYKWEKKLAGRQKAEAQQKVKS